MSGFEQRTLVMPGGVQETVVIGGHEPEVAQAVADTFRASGIDEIAVLGWASQGPSHALNLRDTLQAAGSDINVIVGLRDGSDSRAKAEAHGFEVPTILEAVGRAGLVLCLISDAAQTELYQEILMGMQPTSTFGLAHGFLEGFLQTQGTTLAEVRPDVNHVMVAPKGMGPSVRRLYEDGSGINSSMAIQHDRTGRARDIASAWAVGIGSPFVFETTVDMERKSDIFGERAILLGGVHGIVEAVAQYYRDNGHDGQDAYRRSVESLTGPISRAISEGGLKEVVNRLVQDDEELFDQTYTVAYPYMRQLMEEIYQDVSTNREIGSVVDGTKRLETYGWTSVANQPMWEEHGAAVRAERSEEHPYDYVDPIIAGLYLAGMIAQADVLAANGHSWTEIANETIIEAVDSLNPYMHAKGIDAMVDNCSTTARLGDRKWSPRFSEIIRQGVFPVLDGAVGNTGRWYYGDFASHPVHQALAVCSELRPPVSIAVQ